MPLAETVEAETILRTTHREKCNVNLARCLDGSGFQLQQVAFDRITKSVFIEREDVPALVAALSEHAPEVGCVASVPAEPLPAATPPRDPLQEFELEMAAAARKIATTLLREGSAARPHPESLVDELLMDVRPHLKAAFQALYLGLRHAAAR